MLNFLFIVFLIILIVPYIFRLLAPFMMKYFMGKVQKNMQNQMRDNQERANDFNGSEADNNTIHSPESNQKTKKNKEELGDYVDFEEVKED